MTQLLGYFENLEPATVYEIMCILSIESFKSIEPFNKINSDWHYARTDCDSKSKFILVNILTIIINFYYT